MVVHSLFKVVAFYLRSRGVWLLVLLVGSLGCAVGLGFTLKWALRQEAQKGAGFGVGWVGS